MPTDSDLMKRFMDGDNAAMDEMVRRYARRLLNHLYRSFATNVDVTLELCEDLVQETFVRIVQIRVNGGTPYDPDRSSFYNWLYTIAKRLAINALKKCRRADVDPDDLSGADGIDPGTRRELHDCLGKLEPDEYNLVMQRYFEGYPYDDLADEFGTSANTLRQRLHRALKKLKKCMGTPPAARTRT